MATQAVDATKDASMSKIAEVLKGAGNITTSIDDGKLADLKKQRDHEKKVLKDTAKLIKLETRKNNDS